MPSKKPGKVPVSTRALLQRINRALLKDKEMVKTTRGESTDLGPYYRLDLHNNLVIDTWVDLDELGRELGALKDYETLDAKK